MYDRVKRSRRAAAVSSGLVTVDNDASLKQRSDFLEKLKQQREEKTVRDVTLKCF
jgi:ribose 1,5-bisphosphokinase PhnN